MARSESRLFHYFFFCRSGLCKALKETTKKMVTPCCVHERCACAIEVSVEMTGLSECLCEVSSSWNLKSGFCFNIFIYIVC